MHQTISLEVRVQDFSALVPTTNAVAVCNLTFIDKLSFNTLNVNLQKTDLLVDDADDAFLLLIVVGSNTFASELEQEKILLSFIPLA